MECKSYLKALDVRSHVDAHKFNAQYKHKVIARKSGGERKENSIKIKWKIANVWKYATAWRVVISEIPNAAMESVLIAPNKVTVRKFARNIANVDYEQTRGKRKQKKYWFTIMSAPADMPANNYVNPMQTSDGRSWVHHPVNSCRCGRLELFTELRVYLLCT